MRGKVSVQSWYPLGVGGTQSWRGQRTCRELCWLRMEEPGGEVSQLSWPDEQEFGFYSVSVWKPLEGLIQECQKKKKNPTGQRKERVEKGKARAGNRHM